MSNRLAVAAELLRVFGRVPPVPDQHGGPPVVSGRDAVAIGAEVGNDWSPVRAAQARDGRRYQRALLSGEAHALDVLTIDPQSHEFTRERYRLSDEAFQSARAAVEGTSAEGCTSPAAHDAAIRRNETLMRFAEGRPQQRLLWRCELTEPTP